MKIEIKKLDDNAKLPTKKHIEDACYDLYSLEDYVISPKTTAKIKTGIVMKIPDGYYGRIYPRSSLAIKGLFVNAGIIDSNYRGEIIVVLYNSSHEPYVISKGDRIAQFTLHKQYDIDFIEVDEINKTNRNDNGFGSTGK